MIGIAAQSQALKVHVLPAKCLEILQERAAKFVPKVVVLGSCGAVAAVISCCMRSALFNCQSHCAITACSAKTARGSPGIVVQSFW